VSFFKRMFSADYRRAVAAEAAGDYAEAARAYALAGEHARVAEMHLLRAERAPSPDGALAELRAAVRWADAEEPDGKAVRRRIARALVVWAKKTALATEADKQVVREAAALFAEAGDFAGAGECHELIGEEMPAADAYQKAGDLDKLEAVLGREESRRKKHHRVADAFEEYKLKLASGERDHAIAALRACVDEGGGTAAEYRRKLEDLEARLISDGKVRLTNGPRATLYVGAFPMVVGREATCHLALRDAGVSRQHFEIRFSDGKFQVHDLGSKNGTTLGGVPIASGGTLPLDGAGELGVGEHCTLAFTTGGAHLELSATRGLDRGLSLVASARPFALDGGELRFAGGRPLVAGADIRLNGVHCGGAVQLIRGDVIELGGARLEVT
jgi:hypothetical protein